jgi:hypothetical protein
VKKKFYIAIGCTVLHALATIIVNMTVMGWSIANGDSFHPQPKPDFIKNLEVIGSYLILPFFKVFNDVFQFICRGFHIPGFLDFPILFALIILNSASIFFLGLGLWIVIKNYMSTIKENRG